MKLLVYHNSNDQSKIKNYPNNVDLVYIRNKKNFIMPTVVTNGDYGWRVTNLTPKERLDAFIISKDFDA